MNEYIKKISAILLAFVVLFSTMSVTVHQHYCGDELVDSSLFSKATTCEMDMSMNMNMEMGMTMSSEDCSLEKTDDCCEDVLLEIEGQDELKNNFFNLDFEQQVFVASFVYSYVNLFEGLETNVVPFRDYSPPLLIKDIQVLDEVFLI